MNESRVVLLNAVDQFCRVSVPYKTQPIAARVHFPRLQPSTGLEPWSKLEPRIFWQPSREAAESKVELVYGVRAFDAELNAFTPALRRSYYSSYKGRSS